MAPSAQTVVGTYETHMSQHTLTQSHTKMHTPTHIIWSKQIHLALSELPGERPPVPCVFVMLLYLVGRRGNNQLNYMIGIQSHAENFCLLWYNYFHNIYMNSCASIRLNVWGGLRYLLCHCSVLSSLHPADTQDVIHGLTRNQTEVFLLFAAGYIWITKSQLGPCKEELLTSRWRREWSLKGTSSLCLCFCVLIQH